MSRFKRLVGVAEPTHIRGLCVGSLVRAGIWRPRSFFKAATKPALGRRCSLRNVTLPLSSSIAKRSPGWNFCRWQTALGMVIWPLLVIVVVIIDWQQSLPTKSGVRIPLQGLLVKAAL